MAQKSWIALLLLCSGCYFYFPEARRTKTPVAAAGTEIEVESGTKTGYRKCRDSRYEDCVWRKGELKHPYEYKSAKFFFDGKRLTQGQIRALTEPEVHDRKYKEIEELKGTCNVSLIPTAIYMAGAIGIIATALLEDQLGDRQRTFAIASIATMLGGAAISYPLGGYACVKAKKRAGKSGINDDTDVDYFADLDDQRALERIRVTEEAVAAFNRRVRETPADAPPAETPAETPPVETPATDTPTPDVEAPGPAAAHPIRDALVADGRFKTFVRLFDALELATKIDASDDFTVFAPTDAAFARAGADQVERLFVAARTKDKKRAQNFLLGHFARYANTYDELLAQKSQQPTRHGTIHFENRSGKLVIKEGGIAVSAPAIQAGTSVIYAIDSVILSNK